MPTCVGSYVFDSAFASAAACCFLAKVAMPLIFTFMLASFPAGLVIYWAWNNLLSVIQQSYIMRKNGVKVELFDNIKSTFQKKSLKTETKNSTV